MESSSQEPAVQETVGAASPDAASPDTASPDAASADAASPDAASPDAASPATAGPAAVSDKGDAATPQEGPAVAHGEDKDGKMKIFKLFQSKIGMDVTNFTLPVFLCEPVSTLQRMCEMLHFAELLNQAADLESPLERLAYATVFYLSGFNGTERFNKPFNPVLGETFEYIDAENGSRFIAEQVSHHPPVSACHAANGKFQLLQESTPKSIFLGNSIELDTRSNISILFPKTNDLISVSKYATTRAHNLLIGFAWIDHFGPMTITNRTTGHSATLLLEKCGMFDKNRHVLNGQIRDAQGNVHLEISGKWTKTISIKYVAAGLSRPPGTVVPLWTRPKPNAFGKYKLTSYVLKLNELTPEYERLLPPTDARLRPDRRALEKGETRMAGTWKGIIETQQRQDHQEREKGKLAPYKPRWFRAVEVTGGDSPLGPQEWEYVGGYWEERQQKEDAIKIQDEAARQKELELLATPSLRGTACDFKTLVTSHTKPPK